MTTEQQAGANGATDQAVPLAVPENTLAAWQSFIDEIPDAEDRGGGYDRIFEQLGAAESADDLNAPWETSDAEQLAGVPLTLRGVVKAPAEKPGGLPFYLIVDAVNETTGEAVTFTTGSVNIVGQLVIANHRHFFPCRATVEISNKPTARGFYPQRLRFLPAQKDKANGGNAGA